MLLWKAAQLPRCTAMENVWNRNALSLGSPERSDDCRLISEIRSLAAAHRGPRVSIANSTKWCDMARAYVIETNKATSFGDTISQTAIERSYKQSNILRWYNIPDCNWTILQTKQHHSEIQYPRLQLNDPTNKATSFGDTISQTAIERSYKQNNILRRYNIPDCNWTILDVALFVGSFNCSLGYCISEWCCFVCRIVQLQSGILYLRRMLFCL